MSSPHSYWDCPRTPDYPLLYVYRSSCHTELQFSPIWGFLKLDCEQLEDRALPLWSRRGVHYTWMGKWPSPHLRGHIGAKRPTVRGFSLKPSFNTSSQCLSVSNGVQEWEQAVPLILCSDNFWYQLHLEELVSCEPVRTNVHIKLKVSPAGAYSHTSR